MNECRWCGLIHGPRCPSVKAIEYFPDGTVKRVEFMTPSDYLVPQLAHSSLEPPWRITSEIAQTMGGPLYNGGWSQ